MRLRAGAHANRAAAALFRRDDESANGYADVMVKPKGQFRSIDPALAKVQSCTMFGRAHSAARLECGATMRHLIGTGTGRRVQRSHGGRFLPCHGAFFPSDSGRTGTDRRRAIPRAKAATSAGE